MKTPSTLSSRSNQFSRKFKLNRDLKHRTKVHSTATILDWCYCTKLHTDSIDWNRFMRLSKGNGTGKVKVKTFIDIMYQNLPCKLGTDTVGTQLDTLVSRYKPDILFLGEVDSEDVKAGCPDGYSWVGGSLKAQKELIRVSAIINDKIPYKTFNIKTKVPAVGLKVGEWSIVGIYREWAMQGDQTTKSREQQIDRLQDFVSYWLTLKGKCCCMGDFNFDPHPETEYQKQLEPIRTCVNDVVIPAGWTQLIQEKTRFEKDKAPSLLDHVYTTMADRVTRTWNENTTGYDHNLVGIRVKAIGQISKEETFEFRDLDPVTNDDFREVWDDGDPGEIFREKDPSEAVKIWEHKVHRALEIVAPKMRIKSKTNHNPWFTAEHKKMCEERDRLKKESDLYGTSEAIKNFKKFRNKVTATLQKARFEWKKDHLTVDDSKKMWNRIKKLAGLSKVKTDDMVIVTEEGEITDPQKQAEFMNTFFKQKVKKLQETLTIDQDACMEYAKEYMKDKGMEVPPKFAFKTVGTGVVSKIIRRLKNTGAEGTDQISTKILKKFRHTLAAPLRHIINQCIRLGTYPSPWKTGLITPLPKTGDLTNPKNWRPVCINCAASKILEGVLQAQLQEHMEQHQIFSPTQHAYRRKRSCESALIDLDTHIQKARNEGKVVGLLMTDMSAAFNLIKKSVLLSQLKIYGMNFKSRSLVHSYLSGRKTKCRIKGCISGEECLDTGVGEGSVLGPGFFICGTCSVSVVAKRTMKYMEELGFWAEIWTLEFADDTSGILICRDEAELQLAVGVMMEGFTHYFNSMGMCLNAKKSELIVFRSKKKEFTLTLPGGQEETNCVRLLGLWIDNSYKFDDHTQKVCQKLRYKIANITRVRPYISQERAKMITESLVHSTIGYMAVIYLRLPVNQKKVQKLLNAAARVVLKAEKRAHIVDLLRELYWLNTQNMYEYLLICVMRRLTERLMTAPVTFTEVLVARPGLYKTRSQHLRVQWSRIGSHGRNSFSFMACQAYNHYELHGEWHEDEETFRAVVKFRIFKGRPNGNI